MSSDIPRFDFRCPCDMGGYVDAERWHDSEGEYVEWDDYKMLQRERDTWKHTADEQSKNVTFLRDKEQQARQLLEQECRDVDNLLEQLGLEVNQCRTEAGFLNVPRIITKVSEMRVDAAVAELLAEIRERKE